jgi:hypothetical protein
MKVGIPVRLSLLIGLCLCQAALSADSFPLVLTQKGPRVELSWPTAITNEPATTTVLPEYEVQFSTDLSNWKPLGGKVRGISSLSGATLTLSIDQQPGPVFYRVKADLSPQATNQTGVGGADTLGYDSQFSSRLTQLGHLSVQDFATNAPKVAYLPQLDWDPTTAQFWTNFSSTNFHDDYVLDNRSFQSTSYVSTNIPYNYVLDPTEFGLFQTNGFVVSERLGSASFGDAYYRIFNADLPVFVTADSVLHAWHRSYQRMLEELEEVELATLLSLVTSNMSVQLPQTWQQYGQGPLSNSILDADYFLTVARSLSAGQQLPSTLGNPGVDQQVAGALSAVYSQALVQTFPIFGAYRAIDFSQFIVRGHYTDSVQLSRYFLTTMWCGRIDLRLATFPPNKEDDIRQLGTAVVMSWLLNTAGQFDNWSALEQITRAFVGITDSMTFAQLGDLLANANIRSPADIPDLLTLTNLQTRLLTGELGVQAIQGEFMFSPCGPEQLKLPRSFTICGQKFVMDSWAFSQLVYDRILWSPDDVPYIINGKVVRRKPSCLDVAFSVFGNDQVVQELVARMLDNNGEAFRDGPHLPYQHNLLALRQAIDQQDPSVWTNNIYTAWLGALRALSAPTTDSIYPEAMRARPWAMKTLNTQLASWTQLRHDTVLYAQQSYTADIVCSYPNGFVEPRPEFWHQMKALADTAAAAISTISLSELAYVRSNQIAFLTNFSAQVSTLEEISVKELAQEPLSIPETDFLKNLIELVWGYSNFRQWNGWYPKLFYQNLFYSTFMDLPDCDFWDALVTDVHSDPPDGMVGDPGAVVHEGVANVNLLLIAIDNGPDRMVYAGPVLSHYEFEMPGLARMTDQQWKTNVLAGQKPLQPDWTRSYLVPGTIPIPSGNR